MGFDVEQAVKRSEKGKQHKAACWNNHWQLVSEYFNQRKADFVGGAEPGAFLNSDVWTGRPSLAAETAASALLGIVWPDNHSFAIEPYGDDLKDDAEVKDFFEQATEKMQEDMDDPSAGLALALDEIMLDYLVTQPALLTEEGEESTYAFDALNVQQFSMAEGRSGVGEIFDIERKYSVRRMVAKYGFENCSEKVQQLFKSGQLDDDVRVLHAIEPRTNKKGGYAPGPGGMAYASAHIEVETKKMLRESGYQELPIFAPRFSKRIGEIYGRTPAMRALPDVLEINQLWEIISLATEKIVDPALYTFFNTSIDTSAGALNALDWNDKLMQMMGTNKPIGTVQDVGDIRPIDALLQRLEGVLNDHFMIDRLIDQNNETQMTAREYLGRQSIRQMSLRSPLSRLLTELFDPMITRCFNIGFRQGKFGYAEGTLEYEAAVAVMGYERVRKIPRKIVEMAGSRKNVFKIRYFTPAARERRADEAQGIMNWYAFLGEVGQRDPSVMDIPNLNRTATILAEIWNVPNGCKNRPEEVKAIQKANLDAATQNRNLETAGKVAQIAALGAKAKADGQRANKVL